MIFILTSVCMAIRFFQEFAKEQKAEENEKKELDQNCRWYLIQFAIGFFAYADDPLLQHDDRGCFALALQSAFVSGLPGGSISAELWQRES